MKRRQKGEGSITLLKNGNIRVRIEVEPINGKRQWLSATAATKKEAIQQLKRLERAKEDNKYIKRTSKTYKDFLEDFLADRKTELKVSSYCNLEATLKKNLEVIGDMPLQAISTETINTLITIWRTKGNSENTISEKKKRLNAFFTWCVEQKHRIDNPMRKSFSTKTTKAKRSLQILSIEEHQKLRKYMRGFFEVFIQKPVWGFIYRMYPLYLLAFETGMRRGELLGLKWSSVDFVSSKVFVENNITAAPTRGTIETTPKTSASFRELLISVGTIGVLKKLRELYDTYKVTSEYVFCNTQGTYYNPTVLNKCFNKCLEEVGITRKFTFHDIRHTNASFMIHKGVDNIIIAERLGHSSIVVTLSTYAHIFNDIKQRKTTLIDATA